MNTLRHSTSRGFSLIELLIVAAVIGLIVAIAIPNLLNAIQRARQTRSVADMNALGKAVSMYQQDRADYPIAESLTEASMLQPHLVTYMTSFVQNDGWMRPFMYESNGHGYTLISFAMDGVASLPYTNGATSFFSDDIVMTNGVFMQWPDGPQQ